MNTTRQKAELEDALHLAKGRIKELEEQNETLIKIIGDLNPKCSSLQTENKKLLEAYHIACTKISSWGNLTVKEAGIIKEADAIYFYSAGKEE